MSTGLIRLSTAKSLALLKVAVVPEYWKPIALAVKAASVGAQSITVCPVLRAMFVEFTPVVMTAPLVPLPVPWNDCAEAGVAPTTSEVAMASVEHSEIRPKVRITERVIMTSTEAVGW